MSTSTRRPEIERELTEWIDRNFKSLNPRFSELFPQKVLLSEKRVKIANFGKKSALLYAVKEISDFPVPSRDVTNQTFPGRE